MWKLYNSRINKGESIRVFPISNWTETDIWQYIQRENIDIVPLYFAKVRPVIYRDGNIIMVDDDRLKIREGEKIEYKSGAKVRREGRTRCIFDNGTESSMLYRSLGKALKLDGFCISDLMEQNESSVSIDSTDVQNGYIYVLRSLSRAPQIRSIRNLYKIGYCSGDVTMRIKNAIHEPTYLMNDVEIVLTVRCYNLDVPYLEASIHDFFRDVNVFFEVRDHEGKMHYPKEWFTVPLKVIEEAIPLIANKEIVNYRYDKTMQMIIKKN